MARRKSSDEPLDDPFDADDSDLNLDELRIDDSDLPEDDDSDDDPLEADLGDLSFDDDVTAPALSGQLSAGQVIVGAVEVILIALLALAILLALSFGVIYGGQRLGVVPTRPPSSTRSAALIIASAPTQPPSANGQPAPTQAQAASVPTSTTDPGCGQAADWWNSQPVQSSYQYFTAKALNDARGASSISPLLDQMGVQRGYVANIPAVPCVSEAHDTLLRGIDAIIAAARAIGNSDQAGETQQEANASQAFADLTAALWAINVNADADSPPAQNVARGSGAACGAKTWLDSVQPFRDTFQRAVQQIDLATMTASAVNSQLDIMRGARSSVAAVDAPACATVPRQLLLGAMDGQVQSFALRLDEKNDTALSEYTRQNDLFAAWVSWLGA